MAKGDYGDVKFGQFSLDGWFSVLFERDIFDDTLGIADAHLSIFWRSVKLSLTTTVLTLIFGFPTAYFIATRSERRATSGCSSSPFRSGPTS
jgi:spermidine/putrescine transport system permease protein